MTLCTALDIKLKNNEIGEIQLLNLLPKLDIIVQLVLKIFNFHVWGTWLLFNNFLKVVNKQVDNSHQP